MTDAAKMFEAAVVRFVDEPYERRGFGQERVHREHVQVHAPSKMHRQLRREGVRVSMRRPTLCAGHWAGRGDARPRVEHHARDAFRNDGHMRRSTPDGWGLGSGPVKFARQNCQLAIRRWRKGSGRTPIRAKSPQFTLFIFSSRIFHAICLDGSARLLQHSHS
jgi:hypothetical protein